MEKYWKIGVDAYAGSLSYIAEELVNAGTVTSGGWQVCHLRSGCLKLWRHGASIKLFSGRISGDVRTQGEFETGHHPKAKNRVSSIYGTMRSTLIDLDPCV